ncbi:hypothetical protein DO72_5166 [Burkholderia pseudomallei]|nr:hypothetical protein DO72_5166 [Burkholderia pseudomallei]
MCARNMANELTLAIRLKPALEFVHQGDRVAILQRICDGQRGQTTGAGTPGCKR